MRSKFQSFSFFSQLLLLGNERPLFYMIATRRAFSPSSSSPLVEKALASLEQFYPVKQEPLPILCIPQDAQPLLDHQAPLLTSFSEECERLPLREAIERLERPGVRAGSGTYALLLRRCGSSRSLLEGRRVHAHICSSKLDGDRYVGNHLVEMYGKCGDVKQARAVLDRLQGRNVYTWTIGIAAYAQNGHLVEALDLFRRMQHEGVAPNAHTFSIAIAAAASSKSIKQGKALQDWMLESGVAMDEFVGNSLLDMYRACGDLDKAREVFAAITNKDQASWTSMITAYVQMGEETEAFRLLRLMDQEGLTPDKMTYASLIEGCGSLAAFKHGERLLSRIAAVGVQMDMVLENAVLNMYGKCGRLDQADKLFSRMKDKNLVTWSVMVDAFSQNGQCEKALKLFWEMEQEGERASEITFVSVLNACSHSGLMQQARYYFTSIARERKLELLPEHYGCIVDLLGRAGWLYEAEELITKMPCKSDSVFWMILLGACKLHGDMDRGERAAERVFQLAPTSAGPYVLLANIYSAAGRWDLAAKLRRRMNDSKVKKLAGKSWVEAESKVHEFVVGDRSHPKMEAIVGELQRLKELMGRMGYMPDTKVVLHDAEEEEKESLLIYHSEKLAIALGLLTSPPGTPVRIVKNLRVCSDCHAAAKFISKITSRQIIVRDAKRFHYFEDGQCSCKDYW